MLYTPVNDFGWYLDNLGATLGYGGSGTQLTSHTVTANAKGTAVQVWAGSSITEDVYSVSVNICNPTVTGLRFFVDLLIDPAGGTSWTTLISNLAANTPNGNWSGGCFYLFPIYIKAGTSIGFQCSCSTANSTIRVNVHLQGKPSRPDLVNVGSSVQTLGASLATTEGAAWTPGTQTMGSYTASLGTLTKNSWWWQCGILINDATQTQLVLGANVEAGDASNKLKCGDAFLHWEPGTAEVAGKASIPQSGLPIRNIPSGSNVYVRGWCSAGTGPDSLNSVVVYALG